MEQLEQLMAVAAPGAGQLDGQVGGERLEKQVD